MLRRLLLVAALVAVAFAGVTLLAVEGPEVVELRTRARDGSTRTTRVWVAEADGTEWIEAGNPERPFLADLEAEPTVEVVRGGTVLARRAVPVRGDAPHRRIRALLAEKYGWADAWVGLLVDTSRSIAIRLEPR
jgi:hypothetical protein